MCWMLHLYSCTFSKQSWRLRMTALAVDSVLHTVSSFCFVFVCVPMGVVVLAPPNLCTIFRLGKNI